MALFEGRSERLKQCAEVLLQYLDQGKTTLTVADISQSMKVDIDTGGNIITQLKSKEIVESLRQEEKYMVYTFAERTPQRKKPRAKQPFGNN